MGTRALAQAATTADTSAVEEGRATRCVRPENEPSNETQYRSRSASSSTSPCGPNNRRRRSAKLLVSISSVVVMYMSRVSGHGRSGEVEDAGMAARDLRQGIQRWRT